MSIDGKMMRSAKDALLAKRAAWAAGITQRKNEVYYALPRVAAIDQRLRQTVIDAGLAALSGGGDPEAAVAALAEENMALQRERHQLMASVHLPDDYCDEKPYCPLCRDRGYGADGKMCSCLSSLYREEQSRALSALFKLGDERFEGFDLNWYAETGGGDSPRRLMNAVLRNCRLYAERFGKGSPNLFFCGGPGLGKTYLSACIARVVSDNGASVVYDTAAGIFAKFESERFERGEGCGEDVYRCLNCDLLILDDLGTEMTTSFTVSALYNILDSRINAGRKMIISSNYTPETLARRYTPQIMSRLEGEFLRFNFVGEDIRLQKRRRMEGK